MNNKPNYKKGYKNELLQLVYLCGVIPYKDIKLLEGNRKMYWDAAQRLCKAGLLAIDSKGGRKNMRLPETWQTRRDEYEEYLPKEYVKWHDEVTRFSSRRLGGSENYTRAKREICNGATQLMMYVASVRSGPDKAEIGDGELNGYYTSREVKSGGWYRWGSTQKPKVGDKGEPSNFANTRMNGMLACNGRVYAVYNIGDRMIEWNRKGEIRIATFINSLTMNQQKKEAVIIAGTETLYERILTNQNKPVNGRSAKLNIDYSYDHMYAVPEDENGIRILRMMKMQGWDSRIRDSVLTEQEQEAAKFAGIDCDGYDEEKGIYKLVFCVPDLVKLKNFITRAKMEEDRSKFRIYCFEYQLQFVMNVAAGSTGISKVEIEKYMEKYFSDAT